jgi:hypothetical protein
MLKSVYPIILGTKRYLKKIFNPKIPQKISSPYHGFHSRLQKRRRREGGNGGREQ